MTTANSLNCTFRTTEDDCGTVVVSGDLVYDDRSDELLRVVGQAVSAHRLAVLAVDCSELTYCDSHGLSLLLAAHRTAIAAGTTLRLDNRPAFLDRLLERTNTYQHLTGSKAAGREQQPRS